MRASYCHRSERQRKLKRHLRFSSGFVYYIFFWLCPGFAISSGMWMWISFPRLNMSCVMVDRYWQMFKMWEKVKAIKYAFYFLIYTCVKLVVHWNFINSFLRHKNFLNILTNNFGNNKATVENVKYTYRI